MKFEILLDKVKQSKSLLSQKQEKKKAALKCKNKIRKVLDPFESFHVCVLYEVGQIS